MGHLTKRERKEFKKKLDQKQWASEQRKKTFIKRGSIGLIIIIVGIAAWFVVRELNKPLPGQAVEDLGREHIPKEEWATYKYNSNPPTSGSHDADWIKAGIYSVPQGEGHLVHSLEHGYIIISYNCEKKFSIFNPPTGGQFSKVYAHEGEDEEAIESSGSAELGDAWQSKECKDLKHKLSDLAEEQRVWKLIVVPRPQLDVPIAVTAWGRIDKLSSFDKDRIVSFINVFRDKGPEKTIE